MPTERPAAITRVHSTLPRAFRSEGVSSVERWLDHGRDQALGHVKAVCGGSMGCHGNIGMQCPSLRVSQRATGRLDNELCESPAREIAMACLSCSGRNERDPCGGHLIMVRLCTRT
jgi:hypothetical protein